MERKGEIIKRVTCVHIGHADILHLSGVRWPWGGCWGYGAPVVGKLCSHLCFLKFSVPTEPLEWPFPL